MQVKVTAKQKEARKRNWTIKMLRGCWAIINSLTSSPTDKQNALDSIDNILYNLGADKELIHREKLRNKLLKE